MLRKPISLLRTLTVASFKHLVKEPTSYKNPENPKCIDLMLTNRQRSFQNPCVIETGLSDFLLKSLFSKSRTENYFLQGPQKFSNDKFRSSLYTEWSWRQVEFYTPKKYKYVRANNGSFMNM